MRAVVLKQFGPAENLTMTEVPDPRPGPGQVLIDVEIANITFIETQLRSGWAPYPGMAPQLPVIPGNGVGGVITGTGTGTGAGAGAGAGAGQRVVSSTGGSGGYAEKVVVDASWPVPVPDGLGMAEAVALLADGRTALALLRAAAVKEGEIVLVEAAAGGVGSLLVQLARNAGANVIAAAGGPRKAAIAKELGASQAVDYTDPGWADDLDADVVFDGVGGEIAQQAVSVLHGTGRMCMYGAASGSFARIDAAATGIELIRGVLVTPEDAHELTGQALAEAAAGRIRPVIGQRFPLDGAAAAHRAIERRETIGKTLLYSAKQTASQR